jgi:hypothetical protein
VNGPLTSREAFLVASDFASDASSHALASDVPCWMDFLTWYDVPPKLGRSNFHATVNSGAKWVYCSVHNPATEGRI